jgi:hypothetical protein
MKKVILNFEGEKHELTADKESAQGASDETGMELAEAFYRLSDEVKTDQDYAWSWHCSIAMSAKDVGVDHETANKAANRFMQMCFGVDTKEPNSSIDR